jgi:asparagine synthase (glutamine-hydrolysing)
MCGIVALFSREDTISEAPLKAATMSLEHRGPDSQSWWLSENRKVGLAHARLSIIDLKSGQQPLSNEDNSIFLVANGELYDFERIRGELQRKGHSFKTDSDSEIALHLYEDYGTGCLHHLRGEFAFIVWDQANKTLFAARDRFGIKPLYYAHHQGVLYLASEIKALIAAGVPAEWNESAFYKMSQFLVHTGDQSTTLFKGIYQIPPGHYILAKDEHFQVYPYWDITMAKKDDGLREPIHEAQAILNLRETLLESVRLRMRADVPVACYLSGGLDSCSILGMATQYSETPIHAFTLSFDDHADYDERQIAEEMAAYAKADFHPIPMRQAQLAEHFSDAVWNSETLFFNGHGVAKYLLSRAVRDAGFKVVLTGEGSDEIFAGYPHFRRDLLLHQTSSENREELLRQLEDSNKLSSGFLMPHGAVEGLDIFKDQLGFIPSWLETSASSGGKLRDLLSDETRDYYQAEDIYRQMLDRLDCHHRLKDREPVNQSLYLWSKLVLPQYLLNVLGDRMEMAHSIEGRVPFLDHHVVELASKLPVAYKIKGMTEKYILREAAKPFITDTVYNRQKHPFVSPPSTLDLKQPLSMMTQDMLRSAAFASVPLFDQKKVINLLDQLPQMDTLAATAYDTALTFMLSAACLQERVIQNKAASTRVALMS